MRLETAAKALNLSVVFSLTLMGLAMVPFFAPEAKHRFFFRESYIGYIFGAFPLGYILCSMVLSLLNIAHVSSIKLNLVIRITTAVDIVLSVLFGSLPFILHFSPDSAGGNAATFALARFGQGAAVAILDVMLLLVLVRLFPDDVGEVVGQWQAMAGLGILFGPPIGGALYDAGGFFLPFALCGALSGLLVLVTSVILFRSKKLSALFKERDAFYEKGANHKTVTPKHIKRLLRGPLHLVLGPSILAGFGVSSFTLLESMAPLRMHDAFGVTPGEMGGYIGIASVLYAVSAIVIGKLAGKPSVMRKRPLIVAAGAALLGFGLFLAGPCFHTVNPSATVRRGAEKGVAVFGIAWVGAVLSGLSVVGPAITITAAKGPGDKLVPAAGAIANTANSVGAFVGPVLGSHLIEALGFETGLFSYACASVVFGAVYLGVFLVEEARGKGVIYVLDLQDGGNTSFGEHESLPSSDILRFQPSEASGLFDPSAPATPAGEAAPNDA